MPDSANGHYAQWVEACIAGHGNHTAVDPVAMGHAAMIGEGAPAVGGPNDLDALLTQPGWSRAGLRVK